MNIKKTLKAVLLSSTLALTSVSAADDLCTAAIEALASTGSQIKVAEGSLLVRGMAAMEQMADEIADGRIAKIGSEKKLKEAETTLAKYLEEIKLLNETLSTAESNAMTPAQLEEKTTAAAAAAKKTAEETAAMLLAAEKANTKNAKRALALAKAQANPVAIATDKLRIAELEMQLTDEHAYFKSVESDLAAAEGAFGDGEEEAAKNLIDLLSNQWSALSAAKKDVEEFNVAGAVDESVDGRKAADLKKLTDKVAALWVVQVDDAGNIDTEASVKGDLKVAFDNLAANANAQALYDAKKSLDQARNALHDSTAFKAHTEATKALETARGE